MKTWLRAPDRRTCGSCRATIVRGATMLEVRPEGAAGAVVTGPRTDRCQACGERLFGESAPALPDLPPALPVPQPTLPMALHRGPDFVTPGQVARSVNFNAHRDARMRQAGEE